MRTTSSARGGRKEKKKARRKRTGGAKRSRRIPIIDHSNPRPGGYPPSIAGCHPISILVAARLLGALPSACLKAFQIRVVMDIIVPSFKSCTAPTSSAPHVYADFRRSSPNKRIGQRKMDGGLKVRRCCSLCLSPQSH